MTDESRYLFAVGILAIILIVCARLLQYWKGWAFRTRPITIRPAVFAQLGVVLLFIGVGDLTAIAAGAIPSSPELSAIIIAILGGAVVCFVYAAIPLLLYVPLPRVGNGRAYKTATCRGRQWLARSVAAALDQKYSLG